MTPWAAPFTTAALEAANDSPTNVTRAASAHTTNSIPSWHQIADSGIRSENDGYYDPIDQCKYVARQLLTELMRLTWKIRGRAAVRRSQIENIRQEHRWVFAKEPFWRVFICKFRASVRFGSDSETGKIAESTFSALHREQLRFIAEEFWTTILLGNSDKKDTARLLRAKYSLIESYRLKSDKDIIRTVTDHETGTKPWLFLAAISVLAERGIRTTIIRIPHDD